jgi:hypothetical protein
VIVSFAVASSYELVKAPSNRHSDDLRCNPEQCRWVFQFRLQRNGSGGRRSFESRITESGCITVMEKT